MTDAFARMTDLHVNIERAIADLLQLTKQNIYFPYFDRSACIARREIDEVLSERERETETERHRDRDRERETETDNNTVTFSLTRGHFFLL